MKPSALPVFLAVGLVILPQASQGQRIASLTHFAAPEPPARRYPATYYFEGAAIGAGVFGTTGAFLGYEFGCHYSENQSDCAAGPIVAASLVGALIGGTVGTLVGGLFPAPHPRPLRGDPGRAALLGASAGALWGFGVFPHFCLNGCSTGEIVFALSNTAAGALAGLIVGH